MKKVKLLQFVTAFAVVVMCACSLTGCKKYDDGVWLTFRSATERVSNTWKFQKYVINGVDYTGSASTLKMTLTKSSDASMSDDTANLGSGTWYFQNSKKGIVINITNNYTDGTDWYFETDKYNCTIVELRQGVMHLTGTATCTSDDPYVQNGSYSIEFKLAGQ